MITRLSLQQRLLLLLLSSMATLWLITGSFIMEEIKHEAEEVFDANLVQTAKLLLTLVEGELSEGEVHQWNLITPYQLDELGEQFHDYEHKVAFQITDIESTLLIRSPHAPEQLLSTRVGRFESRLIDGKLWRTFSLKHPHAIIHVGEMLEMRNEISEEVTEHLFESVLYSLPLLALLIWWSVRQGIRPVKIITREVAERDSRNLAEMKTRQIPQELRPMVEALNRLFLRLQGSIDKERRFTADAAHELRTPLAAIRIHAQVARNEVDHGRRDHALEQIIQGVDRTTHLAEQLLALARVDGLDQLDHSTETINLLQLLEENLEMLEHAATKRNTTLTLLAPETEAPFLIDGNRELIFTLARNLIDNAIRYTPAGGAVVVQLHRRPDQLLLSVRDSGPGIPQELQQQIFDRFYRNSSSTSGSGLGLSISRRIAEIHKAEIELGNCKEPGGLEVKVAFPASAWVPTQEPVVCSSNKRGATQLPNTAN